MTRIHSRTPTRINDPGKAVTQIRRPVLAALLSVGLLLGLVSVVGARFLDRTSLDTQLWRVASGPASTSSRQWQGVPGLSKQPICLRDGVSATASLDLSGAHEGVKVRVLIGGKIAQPGAIYFDTGSTQHDRDSKAFSFARSVPAGGGRVSAQWRSVAGNRVVMHSGLLQVLYRGKDGCV